MTYYLGKAGNFVALPDPEAGLPVTPERIGGTHQLLSGARVRDTIGRMRTWQLSYTAIDLATFGTLNAFFSGALGAGPFYFLDPEQRNLLPVNVAAGTDATQDTTGFTASGASGFLSGTGGTNNGAFPVGGTRTLLAGVANGAAAFLRLWGVTTRLPVSAGLSFTFSSYLSLDAAAIAASLQGRIVMSWYNSSGTFISDQPGTVVTGATGRSVVTATAPTNAATADLWLQSVTTNAGAGAFMYADGLQFEQSSAVSTWVPGIGAPLVTVDGLSRSTPIAGVCDAQMTLVQVG